MTTMGAGTPLRFVHTAILVAVCVTVSGFGHDLASGVSPAPGGYLLAVPPVALVGWWLSRRPRSAGTVIVVSSAVQLALHALFGLAHDPPDPTPGHGPHAGHVMPPGTNRMPAEEGTAALQALGGLLDALAPTSAMTGAHALAGAVCGWWLWRGERSLAQLGQALDLFLSGLLRFAVAVLGGARPLPAPPSGTTERATRDRLPSPLDLLRAVPRRGPPPFAR
ncbi:hypothetical protein ACSMX9_01230 [Streptomyces sp. LE64]|uniref:hypothetical protein n=1 Tax=Streptomyces sp. LE64 TaxID=3448653 RepID=UPI00404242BA